MIVIDQVKVYKYNISASLRHRVHQYKYACVGLSLVCKGYWLDDADKWYSIQHCIPVHDEIMIMSNAAGFEARTVAS